MASHWWLTAGVALVVGAGILCALSDSSLAAGYRDQAVAKHLGRGAGSRKLLQESNDAPLSPPAQTPSNQLSPAPSTTVQEAPSTAAIVGGVVGGLGGLTLVLGGALLVASGIIHRWRLFSGWNLLQSDEGSTSTSPRKSTGRASTATITTRAGSLLTAPTSTLKRIDTYRLGLPSFRQSTSAGDGGVAPSKALVASGPAPYPRDSDGSGSAGAGSPGSQEVWVSPLESLVSDVAWRDCLIDPAKIQILRRPNGAPWRLGGGSFGQVYKALYDDVQVVAVKVLPGISRPAQLEAVLREGRILRDSRDRNVVQFVGAAFDPDSDQAMLVTEYMEAGDLFRALKWRDEQGRRIYGWYRRGARAALDAARGLHHLHARHVLHLDLKSANILLARDGTCKLADVGLAKVVADDYLTAVNTMGTFAYCAPEVLTGQKCTERADIFSYGVMLWEICTGEAPSRGTMREIEVPEEAPMDIRELCDRCMSGEPQSRPTAKEIVVKLEKYVSGRVDRARALGGSHLPSLAPQQAPTISGPPGMLDGHLDGRPPPASERHSHPHSPSEHGAAPPRFEEEDEGSGFGSRGGSPPPGPLDFSLSSWAAAPPASPQRPQPEPASPTPVTTPFGQDHANAAFGSAASAPSDARGEALSSARGSMSTGNPGTPAPVAAQLGAGGPPALQLRGALSMQMSTPFAHLPPLDSPDSQPAASSIRLTSPFE